MTNQEILQIQTQVLAAEKQLKTIIAERKHQ